MPLDIGKKIEIAANVAIIVVALLLATVLVKNHVLTNNSNELVRSESPPVDTPTLSALEIDWSQSDQTLVLAVSSTCRFCTESAPFYQQLAAGRGSTRLVVVLPQSVDEGKRYLDDLGVSVDEIRQVTLRSLNVRGTPTLMLVNRDGVLINTWVGKLAEEQQQQVLYKML